jgi:rhodanese-related sulfurtransferase
MLYEAGHRNMKVLDEGIIGWHEKRLPMAGTKIP